MTDFRLASRGDVVLVACSGGPDSTALLHALASLRDELGVSLVAHGVDHGLRPEAADELALVERLATSLAVPFESTRVDVRPGGNLQARAREARREALAAAAQRLGAARIATGHTADDRAETLLMRVVRGTGVAGLGVLPPSAGALIRPLHRARRSDVLLHLERHRVAWASDPSNRNPRFLRVRVRSELLPLLESLSPKVVTALCALADSALELEPDPLRELGRAPRAEIARALSLGKDAVRLWLPGGLDAVVPLGEDGGSRPARAPRPRKSASSERVKKR